MDAAPDVCSEVSVRLHDMVPLKVASSVIKSLLYKGIFNEYNRCLDGSETNLSGPVPLLKAAQRATTTQQQTMAHTKKNLTMKSRKGQANDNNLLNMPDKKPGHAQMQ